MSRSKQYRSKEAQARRRKETEKQRSNETNKWRNKETKRIDSSTTILILARLFKLWWAIFQNDLLLIRLSHKYLFQQKKTEGWVVWPVVCWSVMKLRWFHGDFNGFRESSWMFRFKIRCLVGTIYKIHFFSFFCS